MGVIELKKTISSLVETAVEAYAEGSQVRHEAEVDNPEGIINIKIHNVFIEALCEEIRYYTAPVRSLDSSLGNMLESLAINIAKLQSMKAHEVVMVRARGFTYASETCRR